MMHVLAACGQTSAPMIKRSQCTLRKVSVAYVSPQLVVLLDLQVPIEEVGKLQALGRAADQESETSKES
jgi:hypothetical protein